MAENDQRKENFDKQKVEVLASMDLSRKGDIDEGIRDFISYLNEQEDYVTLSSCSGRIIVVRGSENGKKFGCRWIFVSHDPIEDPKSIWNKLNEELGKEGGGGVVTFKFEAFILHLQCRDLEAARKALLCSTESGFRNSGLTVSKSGKIVLAVRSSHGLEIPLTDEENDGTLLIDEKYIEFIVKLANRKLAENQERHRILFAKFKELMALKPVEIEARRPRPPRKVKEVISEVNLINEASMAELMDSYRHLLEEA